MRLPKTGTLVYATWEDSHSHSGPWVENKEACDTTVSVCHSVGWLLAKSKDTICLAAHMGARFDDDVAGTMTIPRSCLKTLTTLENPRD